MEHHQYYQEQQHEESNTSSVVGGSVGGNKSSFLCRQSGTRWIPTADQIRILRDLYYNMGIRSPTAEEIQKISAALRKYGKIEGKNVFYWFQNHKARERQKKRLTMGISSTTSTPNNSTINTMSPGVVTYKLITFRCIYLVVNFPPFSSSNFVQCLLGFLNLFCATGRWCCGGAGLPTPCSSPGLYGCGQMGSSGCGGSMIMERSFRVRHYLVLSKGFRSCATLP